MNGGKGLEIDAVWKKREKETWWTVWDLGNTGRHLLLQVFANHLSITAVLSLMLIISQGIQKPTSEGSVLDIKYKRMKTTEWKLSWVWAALCLQVAVCVRNLPGLDLWWRGDWTDSGLQRSPGPDGAHAYVGMILIFLLLLSNIRVNASFSRKSV